MGWFWLFIKSTILNTFKTYKIIKFLMRKQALSILLCISFSLYSQPNISFYEDTHDYAFVSSSTLKIRNKPNLKGKLILTIKQGEIVEIIKSDSVFVTINKIKNKWYQLRTKDNVGWAFGGGLVLLNKEEKPLPEKMNLLLIAQPFLANIKYLCHMAGHILLTWPLKTIR